MKDQSAASSYIPRKARMEILSPPGGVEVKPLVPVLVHPRYQLPEASSVRQSHGEGRVLSQRGKGGSLLDCKGLLRRRLPSVNHW